MVCVYCGKEEANTKDHIIPKQLYPKPWPNDFITVPACKNCNYSFRKDEEYFRIALTGSLEAVKYSEPAKKINEGPVSRALERSPKLINMIKKDVVYLPISTDDGKIHFVTGYELDKDRVDTVLNKIIRGLFYIEKGKVLPKEYIVKTNIDAKKNLFSDKILSLFSSQPINEIGKDTDVFEYIKLDVDNKEYSTFWLLCFYKSFFMLAATLSPKKVAKVFGN